MPIEISGTTGISGVDGSASAPALQGTDSNTGINFASDTVNINTGGVTRATIDSSGALDVPTNFPIKINGSEKLKIESSGNLQIARDNYIGTVASGQSSINIGTSGGAQIGFHKVSTNDDELRFYTHTSGVAHAERFRIANDGTFRSVGVASALTAKGIALEESTTGGRIYIGRNNDDAVAEFHRSGTKVGQINVNSSSTSYITSSDYRLKENVTAISDGITRLKTLKPYRFNFKVDKDATVDGFLAHEVTAVPEAITGTKDEVDSDNNPVYQGIDQSKLVPLLTAALQEAVAKIETLETKVAALEAG